MDKDFMLNYYDKMVRSIWTELMKTPRYGQTGKRTACSHHPADAGSRGRDRSPESCRSTGMGAPDEQHPQPCRRDHQD